MTINRRNFIALGIVATAVSGCSVIDKIRGASPSEKIASGVDKLKTIADALANELPVLRNLPNIPSKVTDKATDIVEKIKTSVDQVAAVAQSQPVDSELKQIEQLLVTLVTAVAPFVATVPVVGQVFSAATVVLPIAEALLNMPNASPAAAVAKTGLGPDRAELILLAAAGKK